MLWGRCQHRLALFVGSAGATSVPDGKYMCLQHSDHLQSCSSYVCPPIGGFSSQHTSLNVAGQRPGPWNKHWCLGRTNEHCSRCSARAKTLRVARRKNHCRFPALEAMYAAVRRYPHSCRMQPVFFHTHTRVLAGVILRAARASWQPGVPWLRALEAFPKVSAEDRWRGPPRQAVGAAMGASLALVAGAAAAK